MSASDVTLKQWPDYDLAVKNDIHWPHLISHCTDPDVLEFARRVYKRRAAQCLADQEREELAEGREHLTVTGTFQSDKYPWCPAGYLPLKISDPLALDLLYIYASKREHIDGEFARDLREALLKSVQDVVPQPEPTESVLEEFESLLEMYRDEYPQRTIRAIRSMLKDREAQAKPSTHVSTEYCTEYCNECWFCGDELIAINEEDLACPTCYPKLQHGEENTHVQ